MPSVLTMDRRPRQHTGNISPSNPRNLKIKKGHVSIRKTIQISTVKNAGWLESMRWLLRLIQQLCHIVIVSDIMRGCALNSSMSRSGVLLRNSRPLVLYVGNPSIRNNIEYGNDLVLVTIL